MRIVLVIIFACVFTHTSLCQIAFEKGYFIDAQGQRTECEIKDNDWRNNPTQFDYRAGTEVKVMPIESVKEFGIYDKVKYEIATVNVDLSSSTAAYLSPVRNPEYQLKTIALKVLVEGKAALYGYETNNVTRFYYKLQDTPISPLVYKKYYTASREIRENNEFQQQLLTSINCGGVTTDQLKKLKYKKAELIKYFGDYNTCSGGESVTPKSKETRMFLVKPTIGVGISNLYYTYSTIYDQLVIKNNFTYRLGVQIEMVLPFNNNKWSIIVDPYYQTFTAEGHFKNLGKSDFKATYSSIDLVVGPRYYFFLPNRNNKIFLNGMLQVSKPLNFEPDYDPDFNIPYPAPISAVRVGAAFGAGFSYKKLAAELRFVPRTRSGRDENLHNTDFNRFMLVLSYQLN